MPPPSLFRPTTLGEAVSVLQHWEGAAAPLAGGTWVMRAAIRGDACFAAYVALGGIAELRQAVVTENDITIGAAVTHAELVTALGHLPDCAGLVAAAAHAANPAIRQVATLGGNLCAWAFPASDLAPALLCLDAVVELATAAGDERLGVAEFLRRRAELPPGTVLTGVRFARSGFGSAHVRLPLRKAGDYPVAIVSLAARLRPDGLIEAVRVAVGSVEATARRWPAMEAALIGRHADPDQAAVAARAHASEFAGRDGVEAPGWYRVEVLPPLMRRAMQALMVGA